MSNSMYHIEPTELESLQISNAALLVKVERLERENSLLKQLNETRENHANAVNEVYATHVEMLRLQLQKINAVIARANTRQEVKTDESR